MDDQQELNEAEDVIFSLPKDVNRLQNECNQILNDAIANIERKAAEIARLNVGIKSFQESFYRECEKTKQLQLRIEQLESKPVGTVGYVCNGCEVPCRLDTSGKPFDTVTAVCFLDGCKTGTDWIAL